MRNRSNERRLIVYGSSAFVGGSKSFHEKVQNLRRERDDVDRFVATTRRRASPSVADYAREARNRITEIHERRRHQFTLGIMRVSRSILFYCLKKAIRYWRQRTALLRRMDIGARMMLLLLRSIGQRSIRNYLYLWLSTSARLALLQVANERARIERCIQHARHVVRASIEYSEENASYLAASEIINEAPLSLSTISNPTSPTHIQNRATSPFGSPMTIRHQNRATSPIHTKNIETAMIAQTNSLNHQDSRLDNDDQYFFPTEVQRSWSPIKKSREAQPSVQDNSTSPISSLALNNLPKELIERGTDPIQETRLVDRELILRAIDREQQVHRQGLVALAVELSTVLASMQSDNNRSDHNSILSNKADSPRRVADILRKRAEAHESSFKGSGKDELQHAESPRRIAERLRQRAAAHQEHHFRSQPHSQVDYIEEEESLRRQLDACRAEINTIEGAKTTGGFSRETSPVSSPRTAAQHHRF